MGKKQWKDVLHIVSGKNQKAVENPDGKYPIYGSGGLIGYADDYLCEAGTTIVGRKGTINRPIFVTEPFWNIDTAFGIVPDDGLDPKYLYYFCVYFNFMPLDKSTGRPSLAKSDLLKIEMPVPPLEEQQRIVARIEELFSQLDDAEATLQKAKAQLTLYRQAVLKEAFDGQLTDSVPEATIRLGDYIETPRYGTSKKCSNDCENDKTAVYRIPNIDHKTGRISHNDIKYAQFSTNELDGIRLQQGDILIIRSNGSVSLVGRSAMVCAIDTTGTFAGYLMRLRIMDTEKLLPKYLLLYLGSHQARIYIENKAKSTSGVHNINSTEISELRLPLYDKDAQHAIIEAVESRLSVCDNIEQTIDAALQQAGTLRQSILRDTLEGRL